MISGEMEKLYPSAKTLVKECVASKIFAKDASLYGFSENAQECAKHFMGWTDLASNPRCDVNQLMEFANGLVDSGIDNVVLMGQGGSTQAPMTITKYNKIDKNRVQFRVLDSDSPVRMRELFATCDPHRTLFIVASKSGGTIEPRTLFAAIRQEYEPEMGEEFVKHLVAVTDPGSELEQIARNEGWLAVFSGLPEVGGRF